MTVERKNKEIIVKISADKSPAEIQSLLDYLRYEELTSNSSATDENIESLVSEAKKGRWLKAKKELGLDE